MNALLDRCDGLTCLIQSFVQAFIELIADYLKQGGQTAGHRELWRLFRALFKETSDTDELID